MRRLVLIVLVAMLALLGFYVGWPAWTGYRIAKAFENNDAELLQSKIDFPSVRTLLKPAVGTEIERQIERAKGEAGPLGALIAGQLKGEVLARVADGVISTVVTPANVLRMAREGRNFKQVLERVLIEQMGGAIGGRGGSEGAGGDRRPGRLGDLLPGGLGKITGGLGGLRRPGEPPAPAEPAKVPEPESKAGDAVRPPPKFGLGNIKRFSLDGPLGFIVGVARDPAATEPEVTAHLRFTGGDWKVVGLVPRLDR